MGVRTELPHTVSVRDNVRIPLKDGTRLEARIWLPDDAEADPVPAILEYLPYRWRDGTAERDALNHPYFAGHGYAGVRVDMRGCGDSEGILLGEYLQQEQDDGLDIIAWIAAQPWCDGNVGMIGISWGGFNGLQMAALRPPALKAVVTLCSTDDRYADDMHMMGGCLLTDKLIWGASMLSRYTTPPDPLAVGERWRAIWLERLDKSGLWVADWHAHLRRDAFYKHGSVCEDYGAIEVPVYAVGGWADGYSNAIFRLLKNLKGPRKGLVGPWSHRYPNMATPGPAIGFLQECLRWWDQWLKGIDTGIMDEPMLRVWMQDPVPPQPLYDERPGCWVAEESWPSSRIATKRLVLSPGKLDEGEIGEGVFEVASPQTTGSTAGNWTPHGIEPDLPTDQRAEVGGSLVFDGLPLTESFEILGAPVVTLEVSADRPNALVAVTLSEVLPDGAATRVTYGVLNLTHRDSHEFPEPLEPGRRYTVRVRLNEIAHRFGRESRLRIAISTAYWPLVWPSPETVTLAIYGANSAVELPVRPPRAGDDVLADFPPVESAPPLKTEILAPPHTAWTLTTDVASGMHRHEHTFNAGIRRIEDIDWQFGGNNRLIYTIHPDDPLSAHCEIESRVHYARGEWRVRIDSMVAMSVTKETFRIHATLDAFEGKVRVFTRNWSEELPRDLV